VDALVETAVTETWETRVRAFVEREYSGVARYCLRLLGHEQSARDVRQEAFVRLFGRWTKVAEPRAYVYLVAYAR
jgi:DNA-directed RNA polymerase specialized sigma24 family protein